MGKKLIRGMCAAVIMAWYSDVSAIDCSRARTPPEVAICTNPTLKAFDEYLDSAYANVRRAVPAEVFQAVRRDQIRWIRDRDAKCQAEVSCMIAETQTRTAALTGFAQRFAERSRFGQEQPLPEQFPSPLPAPATPLNPQQIYQRAARSIVVVLGFDRARDAVGQGSGVVIAPDTVATNCHVVHGAEAIVILFRSHRYPVLVVEGHRELDYCILRTAGLPAIPASVGQINNVVPGQRVYTVGSPRGLELTIAEGLVSGLRHQEGMPLPMIQTSAPISPGSSGGGLFDEYGRVIGITTFLLRDSQNLNFALPVEIYRYVTK